MSLLKKQLVPVGGIVAITAIVVVFGFIFKTATPVSAQDIARRSYQAVSSLTAEQQEALKKTTGALDARNLLEQALSAKDLKVLTYDEFASQYPPVPPDPEGKLRTLMFLRFTHSNGMTVLLGIDQDYLPAFSSAMFGIARGSGGNSGGSAVGVSGEVSGGANEGASTVEVINGERFVNGAKVAPQE